jgi:hypothetical protein
MRKEFQDELIGAEVKHKTFGYGLIELFKNDDKNIQVIFEDESTKLFVFPDIFINSYLELLNLDLQLRLESEISSEDGNDKYSLFKKKVIETYLSNELSYNTFINYYDDEYLYGKIKEDAISIFEKAYYYRYYNLPKEEKAIVLYVCSLVAFNKYDGNFWDHFREEFNRLYSRYEKQSLERIIREMISDQYKLNDSRHITNSLVHSIVPKLYIKRFYTFVFDIYKVNLEYNIDFEKSLLDDLLSMALHGIKRLFNQSNLDEDSFQLNATNKTYTLIKSTKLAIIHYEKEVIRLIRMMIGLIDSWYYDSLNENKYPQILIDYFNDWVKENEDILPKERVKKQREFIIKPTLKFNSDKKNVYLQLPNIPLRDINEEDVKNVIVYICYGNKEIIVDSSNYRILAKMGYYLLEVSTIIIEKPLNKISFKVLLNETIIYQTNDSLYRDYIIFSQEGKELKNNKYYDDIVYVIYNKSLTLDKKTFVKSDYKVAVFMANPEEVVELGNDNICFSNIMKPGLYGEKIHGLICKKGEQIIRAFKRVTNFVFEAQIEEDNVLIKINESFHKLEDIKHDITKRVGYNNYNLHLDDSVLKNNINVIMVYNKNNPSMELKTETFILDEKLGVEIIDKEDLFHKDIILDSSFNLDNYVFEDFDLETIPFCTTKFRLGFDYFQYSFDPNPLLLRYKWEGIDKWSILSELEINTSNYLQIVSTKIDFQIFDKQGTYLMSLPTSESNGISFIDIKYLRLIRNISDYVNYKILRNGNEIYSNIIYIRPTVISFSSSCDENNIKLSFDIKCFNPNLTISLLIKNEIVCSNDLSEKSIILENLIPFQKYVFEIKERGNIFEGIEDRHLFFGKIMLSDYSKLEGHVFRLSIISVCSDTPINDDFIVIPTNIKFIKKLSTKEEIPEAEFTSIDNFESAYECRLYKFNKKGISQEFNYHIRVFTEITSSKYNPILTVYIESITADGLTYNAKYNVIDDRDSDYNNLIDYMLIDTQRDIIK